MREYEVLETASFINISGSKFIDEIATREEVYGSDSEFESYKLVDHNIVEIFDNVFNLLKLKKLRIPL
jgi:hypothetical protein